MQKFFNMTGTANIAAGILLLAFWYLYALLLPYNKLSDSLSILVSDEQWVLVNSLGVCGSLLGLLGLVGIYLKAADQTGGTGIIGFTLAFLGTVLLTATLLWDTLIWPILVEHDPTMLDFQGPIYSSKSFVPFFILAGLIYSVGYVVFGLAMLKSRAYPQWGSIFIMVGAPLFGLGAALGSFQVYPRSIGITLLSIGLIWLGKVILFDRSEK